MKISNRGLDLIKEYEGYRGKAYLDGGGVWTIGFGTTVINGRPVNKDDTCTREQALLWLELDVEEFEEHINNAVKVQLNQNQFDALVSIVYNCGPGKRGRASGIIELKNGNPSTLLRKLNEGKYTEAADQFLVWNKDNGKVVSGLTKRRIKERNLFLS